MRSDSLSIHAGGLVQRLLPFGLQDVEQVRLVLTGDSALDWRQLAYRDMDHVDQLLRLVGLNPDDPDDFVRLVAVHRRAIAYLEEHFALELHPAVLNPHDPRELLLLASRPGPAQSHACMALKVMHVVHHVAGRELLFRLPVAMNELFHRIETRVYDTVDGMKAAGVRIAELAASRKTADSVLTKLLSRSDSLAAEVYDRLRFRLVTESLDDAFSALVYLTRHLLPFNYVVPGESRNDLVDLPRVLERDPRLSGIGALLQAVGRGAASRHRHNLFSGSGFRMINFVADVPVRVDDLVARVPDHRISNGAVVFLLTEFQVMDVATAASNTLGENNHEAYKARQYQRVLERLEPLP
ncbi:MAG: TIGR04552 family protein [Myxococcales bacterium]|nr:TIGR04552 family protein [Myxococcales bacterium]MCB9524354.1 TIGR04552 family protein [Myxococcales bacterium]